jgi:uncharacterized protein YbbK (DUF523 family)
MRVLISSCLLGMKTRYGGRDKKYDISFLPAGAEIIPFCPEVEAGLGIPREPIELVLQGDDCIRVLGRESRKEFTEVLEMCCLKKIRELRKEGVDYIVLKSRSPSCGTETPLHDYEGNEIGVAQGIWARIIAEELPDVPCKTV